MSANRPRFRINSGVAAVLVAVSALPAIGIVLQKGQTIPALPKIPKLEAGNHELEFANGSTLHGSVTAISEQELTLTSTDTTAPLIFPIGSLQQIGFPDDTPAAATTRATVKFASGDWTAADVLLIRDGKVELRLPDQQRMSLDQQMVSWVCFANGASPEILTGKSTLKGWEAQGSWQEDNGTLFTKEMGTLVRNFANVPDLVELRMDMAPGEAQRNFMLNFNFNGKTTATDYHNAWTQIRFNEGQLYINTAAQSHPKGRGWQNALSFSDRSGQRRQHHGSGQRPRHCHPQIWSHARRCLHRITNTTTDALEHGLRMAHFQCRSGTLGWRDSTTRRGHAG
jgi:hypothetical protein